MTKPKEGWIQIPGTAHYRRTIDGLHTFLTKSQELPYGLKTGDGKDLGVGFSRAEDAMEEADTGWPPQEPTTKFVVGLLTSIALQPTENSRPGWTPIADTGHFRRYDGVTTVDRPEDLASLDGAKTVCLCLADGQTLLTFKMLGDPSSDRPKQWSSHAAAMQAADTYVRGDKQ